MSEHRSNHSHDFLLNQEELDKNFARIVDNTHNTLRKNLGNAYNKITLERLADKKKRFFRAT